MGALSKNERDGLEDVFMSIHCNQVKYEKLKNLASLIFNHKKISKIFKKEKKSIFNFQN